MKTISANLKTHLGQEVTSLTTLWHLTRTDGVELFFTQLDEDIVFDGDTYLSAFGYNPTDVSNKSGLSVDNMEVMGFLDNSAITDTDLRAGKFNYADVRVSLVNWKDLTQGELKVRRGRLGEVTYAGEGTFLAELRGMMLNYSQLLLELYQPECRVDLGDSRCKIPIDPPLVAINTAYAVGDFVKVATTGGTGQEVYENRIYECTVAGTTAGTPPTYDTVVGNDTVDGTVTFTAYEAWTRHAVVATVTDEKTFTVTITEPLAVDDWFKFGAVIWDTGTNVGLVTEVKGWTQSSSEVVLFLDMPFAIQVGDKLAVYAGCDKRLATCSGKFVMAGSVDFATGNVNNMRAEPYVPGHDELFSIPTLA